jgi:hypothetical protein
MTRTFKPDTPGQTRTDNPAAMLPEAGHRGGVCLKGTPPLSGCRDRPTFLPDIWHFRTSEPDIETGHTQTSSYELERTSAGH